VEPASGDVCLCHECRQRPVIGLGRQGLRSGPPHGGGAGGEERWASAARQPPGKRPAHAPGRSAAVATDECCVALAFTQAPRADRACPSVWPAHLIYELVEDFAGAAIEEEIVIDSRRDCGRASAWAQLAGVPLVARALNRMVAPAKAFDGNEARFGTFVLYSGLISLATGNLCHRKLLVHDALTHSADTSAIRVVGRFRAR